MEASKIEPLLIRSYREGDEEQINTLFNDVFNKERDVNVWKWRFLDNPVESKDSKRFITIAEIAGNIVGQYSAVPRSLKYKNRSVKAVQPLDNIIAPIQRNLKLQVEMFKFIEKDLPLLEGLSFGYGFPNEIAYQVGKRFLKYKDLFDITVLFKRINYAGAIRRRIKWIPKLFLNFISLLSGFFFLRQINSRIKNSRIKINRIEKFSKSFDKLWDRAKMSWEVIGCRDSTYLNWRYIKRPNIPYTIFSAGEDGPDGFIVLTIEEKNFSNVGIIVDFLYTTESVFNALLLHALRYFISKQIDYVSCWAIKDGKEYDILCENGFSADRLDPIKMVYKILDSGIDPSFLKNHTNWLITYGDSH